MALASEKRMTGAPFVCKVSIQVAKAGRTEEHGTRVRTDFLADLPHFHLMFKVPK